MPFLRAAMAVRDFQGMGWEPALQLVALLSAAAEVLLLAETVVVSL
ncbi:MAG: hypothetical protein ABFC57_03675 [Veillonellales bacterium]